VTQASGSGIKVLIPYGNCGIMGRIMEGNGGYYRISIPGKDIEEIIATIMGGL
jgi:hypothetical protein